MVQCLHFHSLSAPSIAEGLVFNFLELFVNIYDAPEGLIYITKGCRNPQIRAFCAREITDSHEIFEIRKTDKIFPIFSIFIPIFFPYFVLGAKSGRGYFAGPLKNKIKKVGSYSVASQF